MILHAEKGERAEPSELLDAFCDHPGEALDFYE
jgi:hypothetical protein